MLLLYWLKKVIKHSTRLRIKKMRKIKKNDNTLGDLLSNIRLGLIGYVDDMDESTVIDFQDVRMEQEDGWYKFSMSFKKHTDDNDLL
jgi:hypothetical protein